MNQTASLKRKRAPQKFYSVRKGHKEGIYHTWDDCLAQVRGFKGATYKSFTSLSDAEKYLAGEDPRSTTHNGGKGVAKFYAVKSGRNPGVYTDWPSAQAQISGWTKPRHKCFATHAEALRFINDDGIATKTNDDTAFLHGVDGALHQSQDQANVKLESNVQFTEAAQGHTAHTEATPMPVELKNGNPTLEDGFDSSITVDANTGLTSKKSGLQRQATKLMTSKALPDGIIKVYTDGSSLSNGSQAAVAGVGVYFGPGHPSNISEPLPGLRQTNQRAELMAILRALESLPKGHDIAIVSDSQYAIKCVTLWYVAWRKKGWKTATGKAVENRDLVEQVRDRHELHEKTGARIFYEWTKGHSTDEGNIKADELAVAAARHAADAKDQ